MASSRYAPPSHHPRQYATLYGRNPAQGMSPVHGGYATMATGQKTGGGKSPKPHNYTGTMIGNGSMSVPGSRPNGQQASQYIMSPEVTDLKANAIATHV